MTKTIKPPASLPPDRKSSYDYDDLIRCSKGELFGQDCAKLPEPDMLMTDRITHISNEGGQFGLGEMQAELEPAPRFAR